MPITIWQYHDAPEQYQKLSTHGGDEDWVLLYPKPAQQWAHWPVGLWAVLDEPPDEDSYLEGYGHVDRHVLENGDIVVIFAHA